MYICEVQKKKKKQLKSTKNISLFLRLTIKVKIPVNKKPSSNVLFGPVEV